VCNDEEKMLEPILKDGMLDTQKGKHLSLSLHKISTKCDDNLKNNFEMMPKNECLCMFSEMFSKR
jgi:hypothetical protein